MQTQISRPRRRFSRRSQRRIKKSRARRDFPTDDLVLATKSRGCFCEPAQAKMLPLMRLTTLFGLQGINLAATTRIPTRAPMSETTCLCIRRIRALSQTNLLQANLQVRLCNLKNNRCPMKLKRSLFPSLCLQY